MLLFLTIGVLLQSFYVSRPEIKVPEATNEIFPFFIFQEMPVGLRGLMLAGIFSTAMGSLSAALNALATSYARERDPNHAGEKSVARAKRATYGFAFLMALVALATAGFVVYQPKSGIIPIVIGILGYTYGAMLGIFLLASLTKSRGNDRWNTFAMVMGFIAVTIMSRLPNDIIGIFGGKPFDYPVWLPQIAFSWRIVVGAVVSFCVGALFKTEGHAQHHSH
jgi:Na+/proline symporter